ncbi:iron-containing alcohol dehydrogenase [Aurantibacter crassamenti]|uniref:iron-containing alcohol dehydrogenase n=1 Tax=Aurantibacter crassamenti TaxID=1837375 RepID=UPI001939F350|nr:iron-containing alcohol dehydrogenase [Aurantibacter crassamenti]MBM1105087.1 iron-containing alcohol dehydrogenase [Aurantibacter crassamenti]
MNQTYTYNFPTPIRFGSGVINELADYLKSHNLKRPLFVTDGIIAELSFFKKIKKDVEQTGLHVEVFTDMHKNPLKSDVLKGGDAYHDAQCDCIVGIGGGVALDVARAIVLRVNHKRDLFDYDDLIGGDKYVTEDVPHFITVPTTSGTGSEVGRSAIISEDDSKKKRILFSPKLLAKIVFADPMLTMELPAFVTAATGMDALTHNMEAYVAKGFHPMCDGIALEGISLISQSLEIATHKPDIESRSKMLLASLMGAVAFQKGLGVVHSLAHPLSSMFDTHHGLANAINLPYGMDFNYEGFEDRFDKMALALGLGSDNGNKVVSHLFELNEKLGLPTKLSAIGVKEEHIDALSVLAKADFCHPNNPKPVQLEDFKKLYKAAL